MQIKRSVVKNECEISHTGEDESGCCFARWRGSGNVDSVKCKEVEGNVWFGFV